MRKVQRLEKAFKSLRTNQKSEMHSCPHTKEQQQKHHECKL